MKSKSYHNLVEGYGAFSIYAALNCPVEQADYHYHEHVEKDFYPKKHLFKPSCIETGYCKYCDVNQQNKCSM